MAAAIVARPFDPRSSILRLTVIIAMVFGAFGMSGPLMTLYLASLGADYRHISLILASAAAVGLVGNTVWGRISDRIGRRKPLIVGGLAGAALAYALLSRVTTSELAWAVRLWESLALAAYVTTSLALMGDLLARQQQIGGQAGGQRGQGMGTYRGIGSLAFAACSVIGGSVADAFSLRLTLTLCAGLYALAALVALTLQEPKGAREQGSRGAGAGRAGRVDPAEVRDQGPGSRDRESGDRPLTPVRGLPWLFLAGVTLFSAAWYAQASLWPIFMATLGYSKTAISSLWGLAALVEAPSMRLIGQLSDAMDRVPLMAASGLGAVILIGGYILLARWLAPLLGLQVLRGVIFASHTTTTMIFAAEAGDQYTRGRHVGLYNAAIGGGQLLGLTMSGIVAQASGFDVMFGVCAALALLGGVCFWLLGRLASPGHRES